ncbi:hypothetical protein WME76_25065 [Sorangium sp. So ce119]|uniref:hypothetical protein n=1 Tax=Sorangium sp. So ce119 TaxID=3133279 RepID=UPI003F5D568C
MLRRLREWLDRALSPRAPAPPDLAEIEAPESGPSDDAPAPPGDDAVVVAPPSTSLRAPTSRMGRLYGQALPWLPAVELRGEGIFIRFDGKGLHRRETDRGRPPE